MRSFTGRLYGIVAALLLLAIFAPALTQLFAALVPVAVVIAATFVVVRLVWFYTSRY
jgi:hypothetical protein